MSKQAVEAIIGKAVIDAEFREALFANPDGVLAEYDLTDEETVALKAIDFETMESFAGTLDERISKMGVFFTFVDGATSPEVGLSDHLSGDVGLGGATGINLPK